MHRTLRIATRGSALAIWQANLAGKMLRQRFPGCDIELVAIRSAGDAAANRPLAQFDATGVFTSALEHALLEGRVEVAVHSLKDLPTRLPKGLVVAAVPARGDVRDAVVLKSRRRLLDLPAGALVGTGSPRRRAQLLHVRADLRFTELRGNVETRLGKFREQDLDAIVLAGCGLDRLGLEDRIAERLPTDVMLPAAGQAAIALEARSDDAGTIETLQSMEDAQARAEVDAERAFLAATGGGCHVPVGALGRCEAGRLSLSAVVASPDGKRLVRGEISGEPRNAASLGEELARMLKADGARDILASLRGHRE